MNNSSRRDFLKLAAAMTSYTALSHLTMNLFTAQNAFGAPISLQSLYSALNPDIAMIMVPTDRSFSNYEVAFNKRHATVPTVRVLCKTPEAISICVKWAQQFSIPLAMRSGGHSYEGFSQTTGLVIDTRLMNQIHIGTNQISSFKVQAGAQLGNIYQELSKHQLVIAAGSCPSVGVSGHTTGGGYGLLSRSFGLACDQLISAQMVNADGNILSLSDASNQDLFWAVRGGGGGSFGVVTEFEFKPTPLQKVLTYILAWNVTREVAVDLLTAWQNILPQGRSDINGLIKVTMNAVGVYQVRAVGQALCSLDDLKSTFQPLFNIHKPTRDTYDVMKFMDAVTRFSGQDSPEMIPVYMKSKSDYVKGQPMSTVSMKEFLTKLPPNLSVMFDCYGGAIRNKKNHETAFAHREDTLCSVQYYMEWMNPLKTNEYLARIKKFYDSVRPLFSGSSYINYCDLDLENWAQAYWGDNLSELERIKTLHDPKNIFSHAQSVRVKG